MLKVKRCVSVRFNYIICVEGVVQNWYRKVPFLNPVGHFNP